VLFHKFNSQGEEKRNMSGPGSASLSIQLVDGWSCLSLQH